jgi:uncharacterized protein YecT (DUF1311 family)
MQHARAIILAALLAGLSMGPARAATPSFNCSRAQTPDERAICDDNRLAELDRAVSKAYSQAKKQYAEDALSMAKETLAARQACWADKLCILDQQVSAIDGFVGLGAKVSVPRWVGAYRLSLFRGRQPTNGLPGQVGQCTFTKIASISDRFGGRLKPPQDKFDSSGTAITFADGGAQVSYDYVRDIAQSRVGDRVLLCLVSIPQNCPPGDDRGRFYSGTNVRTKGSWVLPDSQHMCGGA